jgi:ABC-type branched-subunit amino acid transport system ATPase component
VSDLQASPAHGLQVDGIVLTFGGIKALDGVSFVVRPGEVLGVVGPNGAGKTALLNCISGAYQPQHGSIKLLGTELRGLRSNRIAAHGVARTFQSTDHFSEFTALDYLLLARSPRIRSSAIASALVLPWVNRRERAERQEMAGLLASQGLSDIADRPLHSLPYGMQRRIDLLRVEAAQAKLVLLDEPTSGTMTNERDVISTAVTRLTDSGAMVVIVDHDVDFIVKHCDRIVAMSSGSTLAVGTSEDVFAHATVRDAFLGLVL